MSFGFFGWYCDVGKHVCDDGGQLAPGVWCCIACMEKLEMDMDNAYNGGLKLDYGKVIKDSDDNADS